MKPLVNHLRLGLIVVLLGSVLTVLGKTSLYPNQINANTQTLTLPTTLTVSDGQWQSSHLIQENQSSFQSGRSYRYRKNGTIIDIEIRYLINTKGDIQDYLKAYKSMSLSRAPLVRQHEKTGFYGVFTEGNRSYLSACINPRGQSTFSGVQFARNRNTLDLKPERILPWLLGQSELRDYRCLWVLLSTNAESDRILESTWFSLYPDLQSRFSQAR